MKQRWIDAQQWAFWKARSLGLNGDVPAGRISVSRRGYELTFFARKPEERQLDTILFGKYPIEARWHTETNSEPPDNLAELIKTGELTYSCQQGHREILKQWADENPAFAKAYAEIYKLLYPPLEHWKLHTGEEEYAEGLLKRDKAIIARLRNM